MLYTEGLERLQRSHYRQLLPPKIQLCQIAQTKWSSDELGNGSNSKEMILLKIK